MKLNYWLLLPLISMSILACSDDDDVFRRPADYKEEQPSTSTYTKLGVSRISDDSLSFVLFAPKKQNVYLIGDFNDWQPSHEYKMTRNGDYFTIRIGNLQKDKEYICQYLIDGKIRVADPYANKISDPANDSHISTDIYPNPIAYPVGKTSEIAMVVTTNPSKYDWKVDKYKIDKPESMVIYEVLIRDFTQQGSIKAAKEKISYLKNLGINAIELMPFNEFEGNDSWGYNPSFYFAPDKAYGTAEDYKAFIDECHAQGIGVIMDIVLNHSYGQNPMVRMYLDSEGKPSADNPWYNQKSNFANPSAQWGYDFNHESKYTRQFVDSVCSYWMSEYKIDGFRFDFTKGFSNTPYPESGADSWGNPYDAARISNLKRIYTEIKKRNQNALVIFEHLADNSEEKELAEAGIMLWGNLNSNMGEAVMGWGDETDNYGKKGNLSWGSYKERGWSQPNLIGYMESHDEERIMFKTGQFGRTEGTYNVKDKVTALNRTAAGVVIMMSLPGPKMIWQFSELGYDFSINSNSNGNWETAYEDGRYRLSKKPVRWDYYQDTNRKALYNVFAKMNTLRNSNKVFSTTDYVINFTDQYKEILLKSGNTYACAIANFDVVPQTVNVNFGKAAQWTDQFSGREFTTTAPTAQVTLAPGEYRLYISK